MITIKVLLENSSVSARYKRKHGLSIAINDELLLDVGPNEYFLRNAATMGVDISKVKALALSHSHADHTGGLDAFCAANGTAPVYLFDSPESRYFVKVFGSVYAPVGLRCSAASKRRIVSLGAGERIADGAWFIKNTVNDHPKPSFNDSLYMMRGGAKAVDSLEHEGILVVEDGGELVVFNSCSHNGVNNSIDSVKKEFPGKKIRSYVGGFHFGNPITGKHESDDYLHDFCEYIRREDIDIYTGHCTGSYSIEYLEAELGPRMHRMSTGMEMEA